MARADKPGGYRGALRDPVASRLWTATTISVLGDYVGQGALLILAFERSGGRALGAAALFGVAAIPALLSGGLAGSWLDQIARDRALSVLFALGAGVVLLPLLAGGLVPVLGAAGLLGALRAATVSVRAGALAEGVPTRHRGPTIALLGSTEQSSQVVGYATGAAMTVAIGAPIALLLDAATFLVAAMVVARAPFPPAKPRLRRPPITAGLREIWSNPVLRLLAPLVWITAAVGALPEVLAAPATEAAPRWTPFVLAAGPAGQAVTMFVLGRLPHLARPSVQLTQFVWLALALGLAAMAPGPGWLALANILVGSGVAWVIGPQITFVHIAPPERMAQITGTMLATIIVGEGLGSPLLAMLADHVSIAAAYRLAGIVVLVAAVVGWLIKERTPAALELDRMGPGAG